MAHPQTQANELSLRDPARFWKPHASKITWYEQPSAVIEHSTRTLPSGISHPTWQWFPGGRLNTCFNCVDRHVEGGRGNEPAIFWHSEVAKTQQRLTYSQLKKEVEALAAVLRDLGVQKGDAVVIYSMFAFGHFKYIDEFIDRSV